MPALLRSLGIVGWDALEPAILAALATESPLLLIGPHGSAKTLLLTRLAEALSLVHRHYNASILNFDDLLGYPVPQDGRLVYLQTPATIWEAEAVLFDEVSRCRPELQNKLFPLVHERVVQGIPLARLRHRWAAMNPPPGEADDAGPSYDGAQPLDLALADRFPFVLVVPSFAELSESDQSALLRAKPGAPVAPAGELPAAIAATREHIDSCPKLVEYEAAEYARALALKLGAAGHPLSTRRVVALVRNVIALRAAHRALGHDAAAVEDASVHHKPGAEWGALTLAARVACERVAGEYVAAGELQPLADVDWLVNGAGAFEVGGPLGDNGPSGKKLVAQAYGSAVPIGGGATAGKDPRKVDPRGQALARKMALDLVLSGRCEEATVWLAWRPGDVEPRWVDVEKRRSSRSARGTVR